MILYVCKSCGRYGGMGLALAGPFEQFAKALKGESVEPSKPDEVPCPECKVPMYQMQDGDRLSVLPAAVEVEGKHE
jgi:Zn finger protein HypA/HybF involved in hydrogenase expression